MSRTGADRFAAARAVADAVLYEGYVLYPYRASSAKNQLRWQFGVLCPRAFSKADRSERWRLRTECLLEPDRTARLTLRVRCLQAQHRGIEASDGRGGFTPVDRLQVGPQLHVAWDEAVERTMEVGPVALPPSGRVSEREHVGVPGGTEVEFIVSADGSPAGRIVRTRSPMEARVRLSARRLGPGARWWKVAATVENATRWTRPDARRDEVLGSSLLAVHAMIGIDGGTFVSLLDPPAAATAAAGGCRNDGWFPVLIGDDDVVLASPIILYDHPEVAAESPGDLYDATEIDEILALRVLTLTDEEKAEAGATDPRSAAIIDRCRDLPPEVWERLHGTVRAVPTVGAGAVGGPAAGWWDPDAEAAVDPWSDSVPVAGTEVRKGTTVRLRPSRRSDAQDIFLSGLTATVAGVFTDVDGSRHVAVTVDDDPATAELEWQGRYLFFAPDEVEPLSGRSVPT